LALCYSNMVTFWIQIGLDVLVFPHGNIAYGQLPI
jgi:hypothetical protein